MKKIAVLLLAVTMLMVAFTGCAQQSVSMPALPAVPDAPTEPADLETTAPTEALHTKFPYLKSLPAEACIFKEPDPDSAYVQTIGENGTYTIMEEVRHENGDIWGRLKSGLGWVNISYPLCNGSQLPAVTASFTSTMVRNADHHRAGKSSGEYVVLLTFMPHETVYNVKVTENHPAWNNTIVTMDELSPEKPLVVGVLLVDFVTFHLKYQDSDGKSHTVSVNQNYQDGPPLFFSP